MNQNSFYIVFTFITPFYETKYRISMTDVEYSTLKSVINKASIVILRLHTELEHIWNAKYLGRIQTVTKQEYDSYEMNQEGIIRIVEPPIKLETIRFE